MEAAGMDTQYASPSCTRNAFLNRRESEVSPEKVSQRRALYSSPPTLLSGHRAAHRGGDDCCKRLFGSVGRASFHTFEEATAAPESEAVSAPESEDLAPSFGAPSIHRDFHFNTSRISQMSDQPSRRFGSMSDIEASPTTCSTWTQRDSLPPKLAPQLPGGLVAKRRAIFESPQAEDHEEFEEHGIASPHGQSVQGRPGSDDEVVCSRDLRDEFFSPELHRVPSPTCILWQDQMGEEEEEPEEQEEHEEQEEQEEDEYDEEDDEEEEEYTREQALKRVENFVNRLEGLEASSRIAVEAFRVPGRRRYQGLCVHLLRVLFELALCLLLIRAYQAWTADTVEASVIDPTPVASTFNIWTSPRAVETDESFLAPILPVSDLMTPDSGENLINGFLAVVACAVALQ